MSYSKEPEHAHGRVLVLEAVTSVLLYKKSLSNYTFHGDGFATNLTYTTLRYYHYLVKVVNTLLEKDFDKKDVDIFCILVIGSAELLYTNSKSYAVINEWVTLTHKEWAKSLVNAILRKIDANRHIIYEDTDHSHPTWLYKKLKKAYPENYMQVCHENNTPAKMSLRFDGNIVKYCQLLEQEQLSYTRYGERAIILESAMSVDRLPYFHDGGVYIQDISAIEAVECLDVREHESVLDVCSAPGGKTTHLASLTSQTVVSLELNTERITTLEENIQRMGYTNVEIICADASEVKLSQQFDKIFIDAPCSAIGVIRRHPDIKLLRKKTDITQLTILQYTILSHIWQYLKPGGELVYATCSILPEENEMQIQKFLETHHDCAYISSHNTQSTSIGRQILPSSLQDGFYYAKLTKLA